MDLIIKGNRKLGKEVAVFNVPPVKTCKPTKWCKKNCYALKGKHVFESFKIGAAFRLEESKKPGFVEKAIKGIKGKYDYARIHAAGDFYSAAYVRKWAKIAQACPDTIFLAFTKRRDLKDELKALSRLKNVVVRESLDKSQTKPQMGLKFAAVNNFKHPRRKNIIECGEGCPDCGYRCWHESEKDVVLHEH